MPPANVQDPHKLLTIAVFYISSLSIENDNGHHRLRVSSWNVNTVANTSKNTQPQKRKCDHVKFAQIGYFITRTKL